MFLRIYNFKTHYNMSGNIISIRHQSHFLSIFIVDNQSCCLNIQQTYFASYLERCKYRLLYLLIAQFKISCNLDHCQSLQRNQGGNLKQKQLFMRQYKAKNECMLASLCKSSSLHFEISRPNSRKWFHLTQADLPTSINTFRIVIHKQHVLSRKGCLISSGWLHSGCFLLMQTVVPSWCNSQSRGQSKQSKLYKELNCQNW